MDKGYPWDSYQGDVREYGAQDMANAFGKIIKNGVVNRLTDFLVSPQAGNVVRVGSGQAWINGHTVSVLGFEDVEIPFGGEVTGAKTYGRLVLQAREETAYRDFQIVYKPPVNDASPEVADNEISLAYVASKRAAVTVSTDDIIRDVAAAACVNSDIVAGDYTDITGLIKGEYGKIAQAVPGVDYATKAGLDGKIDKVYVTGLLKCNNYGVISAATSGSGNDYMSGLQMEAKEACLLLSLNNDQNITANVDSHINWSLKESVGEALDFYSGNTDRRVVIKRDYVTSVTVCVNVCNGSSGSEGFVVYIKKNGNTVLKAVNDGPTVSACITIPVSLADVLTITVNYEITGVVKANGFTVASFQAN